MPAALLLSHPVALTNGGVSEGQFTVTTPFDVKIYTTSARTLTVTSNGVVTITNDQYSLTAFVDNPRPLYASDIPPGSAFPWWHYMEGVSSDQGIYWQIDKPNLLSIEWLLLDFAGQVTHFIMIYSSDAPGHVSFNYLTDGDMGANSTIGVQGLDANDSQSVSLGHATLLISSPR